MFDTITAWVMLAPVWLQAISLVVTGMTAITVLTPSTADNEFLAGVLKVLNALAGNFGNNKNADA